MDQLIERLECEPFPTGQAAGNLGSIQVLQETELVLLSVIGEMTHLGGFLQVAYCGAGQY